MTEVEMTFHLSPIKMIIEWSNDVITVYLGRILVQRQNSTAAKELAWSGVSFLIRAGLVWKDIQPKKLFQRSHG